MKIEGSNITLMNNIDYFCYYDIMYCIMSMFINKQQATSNKQQATSKFYLYNLFYTYCKKIFYQSGCNLHIFMWSKI